MKTAHLVGMEYQVRCPECGLALAAPKYGGTYWQRVDLKESAGKTLECAKGHKSKVPKGGW